MNIRLRFLLILYLEILKIHKHLYPTKAKVKSLPCSGWGRNSATVAVVNRFSVQSPPITAQFFILLLCVQRKSCFGKVP